MNFAVRKRRAPVIIIVSLVDILIILLIFFVVSTTFKKDQPEVQINLPESKTATGSVRSGYATRAYGGRPPGAGAPPHRGARRPDVKPLEGQPGLRPLASFADTASSRPSPRR